MEILNRSAVIVKPRQPYLEWMRKDDADGLAESVFESLHEEPHIYLLPEWEDPSAQQEVLEEFWPSLFEAVLGGWLTNEDLWPKDRTLEMFREWFDVEMSSVVEDLHMDEPLGHIE